MRIGFWLKNSRIFSLPMAVLSWLIVFVYSLQYGGNVLNGILAIIGISCGQLATNLFDDYVDYKKLTELSQVCKCSYIRNGEATLNDILKVVGTYCGIALLTGIILTVRAGIPVVGLAIAGGMLVLSYPKLSQHGFSEFAVGIAFGPLLFEGVYYVMTGNFSFVVFVMSLAVVMFTIGLMYVHTVLDFEGDLQSHKKTLVCRMPSKKVAINGVWVVYGFGYLFTSIFIWFTRNYFIFITFALLPLIFDMYKSLNSFKSGGDENEFYYRLLKARNLMVYYSVLLILCLITCQIYSFAIS